MKVLFLDFDGVLNSIQHFLATKDFKIRGTDTLNDADLLRMKHDVNVNNMWVLGYILSKVPDLKIVISSAWRLHYSLDQFRELFRMYKLDDSRIIDKTPKKLSSERYHEIMLWISDIEHPESELHDCPVDISDGPCGECHNAEDLAEQVDYIALDDHPIFQLEDPDREKHEVLTDPWVGLTMNEAFRIIKHFKPDFEEPYIAI